MKFQQGQQVMVLDTTNQVAGSGIIISCKNDLYKVSFKYANSDTANEIEVPEHRIITSTDIVETALKNKISN